MIDLNNDKKHRRDTKLDKLKKRLLNRRTHTHTVFFMLPEHSSQSKKKNMWQRVPFRPPSGAASASRSGGNVSGPGWCMGLFISQRGNVPARRHSPNGRRPALLSELKNILNGSNQSTSDLHPAAAVSTWFCSPGFNGTFKPGPVFFVVVFFLGLN